ncbi:Maf family protein [Corynebacterium terpenotabidum]|uniref:Nucleoside triphosphate pyrophosphatase n=1 Tax=Corynebacterium terpenotabidum Y-11 TaxID=1200352 RepID=S4XIA3_9CORY|nr:nucleoside triphosphate pyrophosphatase [Corynebacterium terpenotabidum]AGP31420.1 Maf-like protein [Corynebacterium terpenotabidum Y-11]
MADPAPSAPRLVLASSSPSRLSVLRSAGIEPLVLVPGVDEDAAVAELSARVGAPTPEQTVTHLAEVKARAVIGQFPESVPDGSVVVAADSMLLLDGELQGKPHTVERTVKRWRAQRGKTATLITGHAVVRAVPVGTGPAVFSPVETASTETVVHFADASDTDIAAYAATGEPLACAGAFTLEALGGWFIDRIEGDPSSVIGLSLPALRRAVEGFGLNVSDFWNR